MDLRLRPYQLSDQSALAALANNPQVSANLKDIFPLSLYTTRRSKLFKLYYSKQ